MQTTNEKSPTSRDLEADYFEVGLFESWPVGKFHPAGIPGKDVWVLRTPAGRVYALKNTCPHRAAPVCLGDVNGTFLPTSGPGQYEFGMEYGLIRCPYHLYEFDLETGKALFTAFTGRVVRYDTAVADGRIFVSKKGK